MKKISSVFTAGFAMFSMFFGSGNLVFPLLVGSIVQGSYTYAILGLFISAVCIPFLGLIGMIQFDGDREAYFSKLGRIPSFILVFFLLALIGPLGVIPRCITVAFGGVRLIAPFFPLFIFSFLFCLSLGVFVWKKNYIIDIIGLLLTPFKLGSIILLIIGGLWFGCLPRYSNTLAFEAFYKGLFHGYQTMDLIASFFFASTIYSYLKQKMSYSEGSKALFKSSLYASIVGAFLLGIVYVGFILLGAKYAPELGKVPPESILVKVSESIFGFYAMPLLSVVLAVSSLATATILAALFIDFLHKDILKNKIKRPYSILMALFLSYFLSLSGFERICSGLGYILQWIYPFLLCYAIFQFIERTYHSFKGRKA